MPKNTFRRGELFLALAAVLLAFALLLGGAAAAASGHGVYENLVRLHVVANSESTADQTVKLTVRDALLEETGALLASAADKEEALALLEEALPSLTARANEAAADAGFSYRATLTLGKEYFPTRTYGEVTLPAGQYTALRVELGEAAGQNWWCVLYPPLCLSAAAVPEKKPDPTGALLEAGLTKDEAATIVGDPEETTVRFRFKLLEFLGGLFGR